MRYFTITGCLWLMVSLLANDLRAQIDTITLGLGEEGMVSVTSSDATDQGTSTISEEGVLPNLNSASRFLANATLGHNYSDIIDFSTLGPEAWVEEQLNIPRGFRFNDKVQEYAEYHQDSIGDLRYFARQWRYAWWNYFMTEEDHLRQRMALALSEILVISDESGFDNRPFALGGYYDILLDEAFGNYRDLLDKITYSPSMGAYLTYINNTKSDTINNRFPDENYARELMQLFSIGLHELNNDGTLKLDSLNDIIPTYNSEDIAEFAKVFTGLSWPDRTVFNKVARNDSSYVGDLIMFEDHHEPGEKFLLNDFVMPNRFPVDGKADIKDALDNVFNHPNTGPFVCKLLIQRLITSNPPPEFVDRIATVFNNNGQGVRGDLGAVARAILLDPYALDCASADEPTFGMLREPFIRYTQMIKALNVYSNSGVYRNDMDDVLNYTEQRPLSSRTVFNFFQSGFQPLGPINDADLVAPEFQITDSRSIAGYINALYQWIYYEDVADEADLFSDENNDHFADEYSLIDFGENLMYTDDNELHVLVDKINLVLAQGRITQSSVNLIVTTLSQFPNESETEKENRVKLAYYLIMSSPEYLIKR